LNSEIKIDKLKLVPHTVFNNRKDLVENVNELLENDFESILNLEYYDENKKQNP